MLLDAVLIVLRETLEAGVLVSVLASLSTRLHISLLWLLPAFFSGIVGAFLIATNLRTISDWFDGVGQEVVDASLQYAVYLLILVGLSILSERKLGLLRGCCAAAVALSVMREGSEIVLFFSTYLRTNGELVRALTSGFVGLMIGVSVGILCYFTLTLSLSTRMAARMQLILLPLLASGMAMQATQLLLQADWLPAAEPLWNSSGLLSENSITGQLAYAVFGYEATPSALEVAVYLGAIGAILVGQYVGKLARRNPKRHPL